MFLCLFALAACADSGSNNGDAGTDSGLVDPAVITLDALSDINAANESTYDLTGTCFPDGASVTVDIGSLVAVANGTCDIGAFAFVVDTTALSDGTDIAVTAAIDAGDGNVDSASGTIDKDASVGLAIDLSSLVAVSAANVAAFPISGTCSPDGGSISIDFDALTGVGTTSCDAGLWDATVDLSGASDGPAKVVDVTFSVGASSTTVSATIDKKALAPSISITNAADIDGVSAMAWSISGTCVTDGDVISISFGSLGVIETTSCGASGTSGTWSSVVDVSTEADGASIPLEASIDDEINPAASDSVTVNKETVSAAIVLNALEPISLSNVTSYPVTGMCSPDGATVRLTVGGLTDVTSGSCGDVFSGEFSLSANVFAEPDAPSVTVEVMIVNIVSNDSASASVVKDTDEPSVTLDAPADILVSNAAAYTFSGTCDDATATVVATIDTVDLSTSCDGTNWTVTGDVSAAMNGVAVSVLVTISDPVGNEFMVNTTVFKDAPLPFDASGWTMVPTSGSTSTNITPDFFQTGIVDEDGTTIELYEEAACSGAPVDSATVSGGAFSLSGITYATDGSDDGLHSYFAVITDVRTCFDTGLSYTLESPGLGTQPAFALLGNGNDDATIVTLELGTLFTYVSADGSTTTDYGSAADPAGTLFTIPNTSQGDQVTIDEGGVMGFTRIGNVGLPWASRGYAGNQFIYNVRNGQGSARVIVAALNHDANVSIELTDGQSANPMVAAGTVEEVVLTGLSGEIGVVITADEEIVVGAYSGSGVDNMLLSALGLDMISVGFVRALEADTTVDIYNSHNSAGDNQTTIATAGGSVSAGNLLNENPIGSTTARVLADKLITGYDRADGDGGDAVSGINVNYLATHYALPEKSDYIMVVSLSPGTVAVDAPGESVRTLNLFRDGSANTLAPWYIGDGADLDAGTTIVCSMPCAIVYDEFVSGDEEFLLGFTP